MYSKKERKLHMNNFRTKAIAEMTKDERDYLRNELNEVDKGQWST